MSAVLECGHTEEYTPDHVEVLDIRVCRQCGERSKVVSFTPQSTAEESTDPPMTELEAWIDDVARELRESMLSELSAAPRDVAVKTARLVLKTFLIELDEMPELWFGKKPDIGSLE